ncbi:MAG: glycosyltransferase [Propionibacteriaceae bacterium]|jgi:GT2 family glycosyltransferase/glycosyltransferase involved in cell wall biosynthesis|nr:glycosyltransferase [Propionibacteriaceae bacterium]
MTAVETVDRVPLVSVVLVNYKGADDTIEALHHLRQVDWPADRMQLIVVDNDSQDGSEAAIRRAAPFAEVCQSGANLGFAGGCNRGVELARGEFVGFINSDAKPDSRWIAAALETFDEDPLIAAVASRVLSWEGDAVDFADAMMTWFGMGAKPTLGLSDEAEVDTPKDVLFATGSAMFVRTEFFRRVGGFDERFFMFYEDVDFGWRTNILGHRVRYAPDSVAYHRHHGAMKKFGDFREMFLLERNALFCLYKNLGDDLLRTVFGGAVALAVRRANARADEQIEIEQGRQTRAALGALEGGSVSSSTAGPGEHKVRLTSAFAIDDFVQSLSELAPVRQSLQAERTVDDAVVLGLFRDPTNPLGNLPHYIAAHDFLVRVLGVDTAMSGHGRVVVVTGDVISEKMAGPAIRAWEMATALARVCEVRLVSTMQAHISQGPGFEVACVRNGKTRDAEIRRHIEWGSVLVFQGNLLAEMPWITKTDRIIVADIYDPFHLEQLEQARDLGPIKRIDGINSATGSLNLQIDRADLMLCASEKQRAFWLGQASILGRQNLSTVRQFGGLEQMIKVVPFGLGDSKPVQLKHGIRGTVPGIGPDDKVILWGGGVYNWFDTLTLVRAVAQLAQRHDDVRLFFMGLKHPNPAVPDMRQAWQLRQLSDELGLTDRHVFFNSGWVPYERRADVLLDADVGVSTHYEHLETAYSFRTRILDYLWAGLPIVATTGDSFGNVLDREGIGIGVPPEDVDALAEALETLLYDPAAAEAARANVARFAKQFRWSKVLEPLIEFCQRPRPAADLALRRSEDQVVLSPPLVTDIKRDLGLFVDYFKAGGMNMVVARMKSRIRKARQR